MKRAYFYIIIGVFHFTFVLSSLIAQPANDDCANAIQLLYAQSEAEALLVNGDTRGATASTTPEDLCSQTFYTDDIWFKFITPAVLPLKSIVIKAYFDNLSNPTDLPHVGMAVYAGCETDQPLVSCFVDEDPTLNTTNLTTLCLTGNQEYLIRIWSGGAGKDTEGTFRIGVFEDTEEQPYFWRETFGGGLENNGWTTEGTCANADSNHNAGWKYLPDGLLDQGAYTFEGLKINSPSLCDGAVGVDSDYNDNGGIEGDFGAGPCPTPGQHILTSPVIFCGDWVAAGLSVSWIQAIRQYQSEYFFAFRTRNEGSPWSDWTHRQINTEHQTNGNLVLQEYKRFPMPGAIDYDSIQIRFIYNDNYYLWGIDDVKIIPQECTNSVITDFYAIAPFAVLPANQLYPFPALADIFNFGACPLSNSVLHCTIVEESSMDTIYYNTLSYATVDPDSLAFRKIMPSLSYLPTKSADYTMTYRLTQDSIDYDPEDNIVSFSFSTGGNTLALEDGFTTAVTVGNSLYDDAAPPSYAYGNYFRPVTQAGVQSIDWGVGNAEDMAGQIVQIYLLQWTDNNQNHIAESIERKFIGFANYSFTGQEGENVILSSPLENFESPGSPVIMEAGLGYIAIVEYQADSEDDPDFFMLASDKRNYTPQQVAMDSAVVSGLVSEPIYFSVLGFSADGIVTNIDYEVKELSLTDNRIFFGNDIVPVVRIIVSHLDTVIAVQSLPHTYQVSTFPNPVNDFFNVHLDFPIPIENALLSLISENGSRILTQKIETGSSMHTESMDVSSFPAGQYYLNIRTPQGERTLPLAVVH